MKPEKKISEWLQELPEPYRTQALENFKKQGNEDVVVESIEEAIQKHADWEKTHHGLIYWGMVWDHYYFGSTHPLPEPIEPKQPEPDQYEKEFIDRAAIALITSGCNIYEVYSTAKIINEQRKKENGLTKEGVSNA